MTLYLDTSALVKLLVSEAESEQLRGYLADRRALRRVASGLVRTELRRAASRISADLLGSAERLLSSLALVRVDDALLDIAGTLGPPAMRTLDAVHLASALRVAPLTALVSYDLRIQGAAATLGIPVAAPGS